MAAIKYFPIHERMRFQFGAEFFNLFNNVNFTLPGLGSDSPNESAVRISCALATSATSLLRPTRKLFNWR